MNLRTIIRLLHNMDTIKTYWKTITPAEAERMLAKNTGNRRVKDNNVTFLASQMVAGQWRENGETIKINGDRILDGQHRLMACVKANRSFRTLVVEGVDSNVFDTIDTGVPRTAADVFYIKGESGTKNLAACLSVIERYNRGSFGKQNKRIPHADLEALLAQNPEIKDSVNRSEFKSRIVPPSILCAFHYLFSKKDPALADYFCLSIVTGENLARDNPAYLLRERLIFNTEAKAKLTSIYISALLIKAWNAVRENKQLKVLKWLEDEDFPQIK